MQEQVVKGNGRAQALSDEEVVDRVRSGEVALFEILIRRHNQRLYRVARSILGSDAEAEDVMQEAYVRAYEHLGQFEGRARFSTWLTRIAVHEALARARHSVRLEPFEPAGERIEREVLESMSNGSDPEREALGREVKVLLELAVDALPAAYRAVFVMREIEEMSTAETAGALGVSEDVVKTRLLRARAMLREDLYQRAGTSAAAAFPFHLSRCDRVVDRVMRRIAPGRRPPG